jgi:hypothetical protein
MRSGVRFGPGVLLVCVCCAAAACAGGAQSPGGADGPLMDPRGALAKQGYIFRGSPSFRFDLPPEVEPAERMRPDVQLVRVQTPDMATVTGSMVPVRDGFKLEKAGLLYLSVLGQTLGRNHKLVGNQRIKLKDGTKAYETRIKWLLGDEDIEILTVLVSAEKADHWVFVAVHAAAGGADLAWVPRSLRFTKR